MPELFLSSVEYSGYISIFKLTVFLVFFFLWVPLVRWVQQDAETVEAEERLWTTVVFAAGIFAFMLWLFMPLFLIGLVICLIAVGGTSVAYVKYRNARVMEFDRVLTFEHIKSLFSSKEQEKLHTQRSFVFITANNNEVPIPEPKTPEFFGYRAAYDIINDIMWRRANTILLTPTMDDYQVTYLIDGVASKQPSADKENIKYFIRFMKNLADLDIKEKRKPQRGKFKIRQDKNEYDWQVTTAGSTAGEQIQLMDVSQQEAKRLAEIGLMEDQYEMVSKLKETKNGLFIISGPRKNGVTTTFCAMLKNHDAFLNSIDTLEKERAIQMPNIKQHTFAGSGGPTATFGKRLKTIVRMGPDIIGISGCEDAEAGRVACEAAKEEQLIYLTLQANSVASGLVKWIKMVGDKDLAMESLSGISNQRLVRKLCDKCKEAYTPHRDLIQKFNIPTEKAKVLYRPGKPELDRHGKPIACERCQGTGFLGRTGVFEIIMLDDELKKKIKQAKSSAEIAVQLKGVKMLYLQERALMKAIEGATAINEVIRVFSKEKQVKGRRRVKPPGN